MDGINILKKIFAMKKIAVVGMSPKEHRPSNYVAMYMYDKGYDIIPVNPGHKKIHGKKCYPSLLDIPVNVDIVNVFRQSQFAPLLAKEAVSIQAKAIWLQDGVVSDEAYNIAKNSGLFFVMNDCMLRRHQQLFPSY